MIILCSICLFSCGSKAIENDVDIFIKEFEEHHPNGYKLQDGWYSYTEYSIRYKTDLTEIEDTFSRTFKGKVVFTNIGEISFNRKEIYCEVEKFDEIQKHTPVLNLTYESATKECLENVYHTCYDGTNFFYEHRQYKTNPSASETILTFPTQGTDEIIGVNTSFHFAEEYNELKKLKGNNSAEHKITLSVTGKMLRSISCYDNTSCVETCSNEYYFDNNYNLIKIKQIIHMESFEQDSLGMCNDVVSILEVIQPWNISVQTTFDVTPTRNIGEWIDTLPKWED